MPYLINLQSKKQKISKESDIHDLAYLLQERTEEIVSVINNKKVKIYTIKNVPSNLKYVKKSIRQNYVVYIFTDSKNTFFVYNRINAKYFGYDKKGEKPFNKISDKKSIRIVTQNETFKFKKPNLSFENLFF